MEAYQKGFVVGAVGAAAALATAALLYNVTKTAPAPEAPAGKRPPAA